MSEMMLQLISSLREKDLWKERTRAAGGSWCLPTKMTVPKRKSIATEMGSKRMRSTLSGPAILTGQKEEFTFCDNGVTCPLDTYFDTIVDRTGGLSLASQLAGFYNTPYLTIMVDKIFEDPSDFLATAKICMSGLLKLVEKRAPISPECAKSLFVGVWLDPRFLYSLSEAIRLDEYIIGDVLRNATQYSLDDRITTMLADECFEETVMLLKHATSVTTFVRFFLSILLGHWTDIFMLKVCDLLMGKNIFGRRIELRNIGRARALKIHGVKPDEVHKFSFEVDDIMNVKEDMEPVKKLLAKKYGSREDVDIESLTLKMKSNIFSLEPSHPYAGLKAKVYFYITNVSYCSFCRIYPIKDTDEAN